MRGGSSSITSCSKGGGSHDWSDPDVVRLCGVGLLFLSTCFRNLLMGTTLVHLSACVISLSLHHG